MFDKETIGNTNCVAIGKFSKNIPGSLCLSGATLSEEMQASKMFPKIWGTILVLDNSNDALYHYKYFK